MKTPDSHNYFTGDPVSSPSAAKAEAALALSVGAQHYLVIKNMWDRGIIPLEAEIMKELNKAKQEERKREATVGGLDIFDHKTYGVLLIGTVFQSAVINQDSKAPQRFYESMHIDNANFSYDYAAWYWSQRDKLLPGRNGWKIAFYHIWAVKS